MQFGQQKWALKTQHILMFVKSWTGGKTSGFALKAWRTLLGQIYEPFLIVSNRNVLSRTWERVTRAINSLLEVNTSLFLNIAVMSPCFSSLWFSPSKFLYLLADFSFLWENYVKRVTYLKTEIIIVGQNRVTVSIKIWLDTDQIEALFLIALLTIWWLFSLPGMLAKESKTLSYH